MIYCVNQFCFVYKSLGLYVCASVVAFWNSSESDGRFFLCHSFFSILYSDELSFVGIFISFPSENARQIDIKLDISLALQTYLSYRVTPSILPNSLSSEDGVRVDDMKYPPYRIYIECVL